MNAMTVDAIGPADLKSLIVEGGELAILDVREEDIFGQSHLLFAVPMALSRLEMRIDDLVPRKTVPIVLCAGAGDDNLVARAAERLARFGYTDIRYLKGGVEAWAEAGYELFSGVNVPSKAFGEFIETRFDTPRIPAPDLKRLMDEGADMVIVDSRPMSEYRNMNIPGGTNMPGAELALRIHDMAPDPDTLVVVNCAGRTRSIIGAQSLINAGIPNRVVALKDGTMGWNLAGLELEHGMSRTPPPVSDDGLARARACAKRAADRFGVRPVSRETVEDWRRDGERTVFLLDVRSPEEFTAGHLAGALSAPGGQLVQGWDQYVGVLGARLVLCDDNGVRATMTASWLLQMGWTDVFVLDGGIGDGPMVTGEHQPHVFGLDAAVCETVSAADVKALIDDGGATVVDLADSLTYRAGHIPGAWFAIRSRLPGNLDSAPGAPLLVLTSPDGVLARLAVDEAASSGRTVRVLDGGTAAWTAAGFPLEAGHLHMADAPDDLWYKPYENTDAVEERMQGYLTWEVGLVEQIARDGTAKFRHIP